MVTGYEVQMYRDIGRIADAAARIATALEASAALDAATEFIREALEGDSNDMERDALAAVADALHIRYTPPDV